MKYDDIINLAHYEPKNHPRMTIENRSSIFTPFSALAGYHEEIMEMGKEVIFKHELSEDEENILNQKLLFIMDNIDKQIVVKITYFVKDLNKQGGNYVTKRGVISKINLSRNYLIMENKEKIYFQDILDIDNENM